MPCGTPLFALNVVAWPNGSIPLDVLGEVLAGGEEVAREGGWLVVGGHTVDGQEPLYGQAVVGEADPEQLLTNAGGRPGTALVLTKALGTGVLATAVKRLQPQDVAPGGSIEVTYRAATASMRRLNAAAAAVAREAGAVAATDVTGFGLVGHLHRMARASGVAAALDVAALPLLPGVEDLVAGGYVPGGTGRNLDYVAESLRWARPDVGERWSPLVADPQTSGGLLFACPPSQADAAVAALVADGHPAARVGELVEGVPGEISLA